MRKRIIAAALVVSMLAGLLTLGGCSKQKTPQAMTRGEWLTMLAESFGLNSSNTNTPYFKDIPANHRLFPIVQGLGDWDILAPFAGDTLDADKTVTYQEIAATAAIAAGFSVRDDFAPEQAVQFAVKYGILGTDSGDIAQKDCEAILANAQNVYLKSPGDEYMEITPAPGLKDFRNTAPESIDGESGRVRYSAENSNGLSVNDEGKTVARLLRDGEWMDLAVGDILLTPPTQKYLTGVAYKITAIYEENGALVFETEQPELTDIFENLNIHTTVHVNPDNIVWAQGVSARGNNGQYHFNLSYGQNRPLRGSNLSEKEFGLPWEKPFEYESGSYSKSWGKQNSPALGNGPDAQDFETTNFVYTDTPSVDDFGGKTASWAKELFTENKFSSGYKIEGKIVLERLDVIPKVEGLVDTASLTIDAKMSAELKLEGNISERLKVAEIPIVIDPAGLIQVSVDIWLYVDASGAIQAQAMLGYNSRVEWCPGAELRKSNSCKMETDFGVEADIEFGGDVSAGLAALGLCIMDAGAKVGGEITASAKVVGSCDQTEAEGTTTLHYKEAMKIESTLYAPIVTLYACSKDSKIYQLSGEKKKDSLGSWELLTKENGARAFPLVNKEWVFWEETVTLDEQGNVVQPLNTSNMQSSEFTSLQGNTNGNFANGSYVAVLDGWVYYSRTNKIFRIKEDGTENELIYEWNDGRNSSDMPINIIGEWIYTKVHIVQRISLDGKICEQIGEREDLHGSMCVVDGWMYFCSDYRMRIDGSEFQQINMRQIASGFTVNIVDGWIYCYDRDDGGEDGICKFRTDGSEKQKIYSGRVDYMIVDGDWIYYAKASGKGIYKVKTDGTENQLVISISSPRSFNISGEWIYYGRADGLYKVKTDGTEKQVVTSSTGAGGIFVIGDWIYFYGGTGNSGNLYKIALDGTSFQLIAEDLDNY